MRIQMPPPSGPEPVVYAPKVSFPTFPHEDGHLPHPPASSPQSWTQTQTEPKKPQPTFVCPEVHCGKQFPRSFALRRHMRIHTGTKPYACDFQGCGQRFNTSGNLSRHKRIHSGERPYPCCFETCGKRFNTSTKLKRHMRIHFPDGENLFRCTESTCAWACDNYKEYVQHQKLHTSVAEGLTDENVDVNVAERRSPKSDRTRHSSMSLEDADVRHVEYARSLNDDFYQQDRGRLYSAPPALMIKEEREDSDFRRPKSVLDDRQTQGAPRLPFPTRAFPSENMGMPSSGLLGSSFHPLTHLPPTQRYYESSAPVTSVEMATSSSTNYGAVGSYASTPVPYSSYLRGGDTSYQSTPTTTSFMSSSEPYSQPMRHEDMDRQYDSSSPHEMRHQHSPQQVQTQTNYGGNSSSNSGMHPVPAEFTGEELSAVLELMKDS